MGYRRSTCPHLDNEIVETAKKLGLNVSRVSENVLFESDRAATRTETGNLPPERV